MNGETSNSPRLIEIANKIRQQPSLKCSFCSKRVKAYVFRLDQSIHISSPKLHLRTATGASKVSTSKVFDLDTHCSTSEHWFNSVVLGVIRAFHTWNSPSLTLCDFKNPQWNPDQDDHFASCLTLLTIYQGWQSILRIHEMTCHSVHFHRSLLPLTFIACFPYYGSQGQQLFDYKHSLKYLLLCSNMAGSEHTGLEWHEGE